MSRRGAASASRRRPGGYATGIRFALAYLWTQAQSPAREPFDELLRALAAANSPWSYTAADQALLWVYKAVGVERAKEVAMHLWRRCARSEGTGGGEG